MQSLIGRFVLGRYRALRLLARGGMGEVYLARQEGASGFRRPVVIKCVLREHAHDKLVVDLFKREARVMASLRHPNILGVLDFGEDAGDHVMVIDYVHGFHVGRWQRWLVAKGERFPVARAVHVMVQVLEALDHAHRATGANGEPLHIVHRDVSPGNVLIDVEGTVKLADFGIARMGDELTEMDGDKPSVKGKMSYLAPEMFDGAPASPATDAYAAAVTLYELLNGVHPFRSEQSYETMARVLEHVPARIDAVRDDASSALADVLSRALAKSAEDRYPSARELASALRDVRVSTADEAARELASAAAADFRDPEMAMVLGVPELSELESAWQAPVVEAIASSDALHSPSQPATSHGGHRAAENDATPHARQGPTTLPAPSGSRRGLFLGGGLVAVALVGAAGATLALGGSAPFGATDQGVVMVVVEHGASGASLGAADTAEPDAAMPEPTRPPEPAPDAGRPERSPRPLADVPLEAPFRARSAAISRCFAEHAAADLPEVSVRFRLDADGSVAAANVLPAAVEPTPLGQCLVELARTTRFPAPDAAVTFHVTVGARRVAPH